MSTFDHAMDFRQPIRRIARLARLRNVALAAALLFATTVAGTLGYIVIADMSPFDAFYMTMITLSTVGFKEVQPLDPSAKAFTIGLIIVGVGTTFYALAAITEFLIEGRLQTVLGRRAMQQRIQNMKDHIILCGYGRFGRVVAESLERSDAKFIVIDNDVEKEALIEKTGHPFLIGSALEDRVLLTAGIEHAHSLVLAMASDSDNVFVALSAREANPKLSIHARGETEAGIRRLRLAGATQIVSPYHMGGERIANAILRPSVVDFLNLTTPGHQGEIDLEEISISEDCALHGISLRELPERDVRVSVVGIKRREQPIQLNPGPDHRLFAGDRIVVVGDRANLEKLAGLSST